MKISNSDLQSIFNEYINSHHFFNFEIEHIHLRTNPVHARITKMHTLRGAERESFHADREKCLRSRDYPLERSRGSFKAP